MATASGELLGNRFKLLSERNVFPFGAWWEAEDDQGARTLVFRLHVQVSDPAAAVAAAIESSRRIDSPHVVAWIDGGVDAAGRGWLAAPMLGPWSFAEHIGRTEGIEPAEAAPLIHQVARGMAGAEKAGVVHHALGSDFLRVVPLPDGSNSIRIYGYGLSDVLPPYKPLRKQDAYVGVPDYMAPELCGGKAVDGTSADIYAIGILMYEAVRGKPPFAPTFASASASTTLKRHIFEKPLPLHVRYATTRYIKPYEAICFKALNKASNRRQATLAELEGELEALVTGEMQLHVVSLEAVGARPPQTARRSRTQIIESQGGQVNVHVSQLGLAKAEPAPEGALTVEPAAEAPEPADKAAEPAAKASEFVDKVAELVAKASEPADKAAEPAVEASEPAAKAPEPAAPASEPEAHAPDSGASAGVIIDDASIVVDDDLEDDIEASEPARASVKTKMFTGLAAQVDATVDDDRREESATPDDTDTKERDGGGRGKGKKGRHKTRKSRRPTISSQAEPTATAESESPERKRAAAAPTVVMAAARSQVDTRDEGASARVDTGSAARPKVSSKVSDKDAVQKETKAGPSGVQDEQDAWFDAGGDDVVLPKKRSLVPLLLLGLLAIIVAIVVVTLSSTPPPEPAAPAEPEGPRYGLKSSVGSEPAVPDAAEPPPATPAAEPTPTQAEPTPTATEPPPAIPEPTPAAEPPPAEAELAPDAPEPPSEPAAAPPEPKPVVADPKPEPKPKRVVAEPKPEPKPVVAEPKPEPKPVVAEPKPEPKPVVAEPESEPKPVVAEPKPKPVVAEPKPKPEPKPVVAEPKPAATSPEARFKEDAKRFMELGLGAYKKDNYKLAIGYFKRALAADPSDAVAARYLKRAEAKLAE